MSKLQIWEDKFKEKRKNTTFRKYLKEICSWVPLTYYKNNGFVSRYPVSDRIKNIVKVNTYIENPISEDYDDSANFALQFKKLFRNSVYGSVLHYSQNETSDYSDIIMTSKNCYLSNTVVVDSSNVLYSFSVKENSHNALNSCMVWNDSDNIYFSA